MLAALGSGSTGCGQGDPEPVTCPLELAECRRNVLAACDDAGVVVETPCDPGRCAVDAPVPRCVPANALPCDPATAVPTCENGLLVECPEAAAYWLSRDCGETSICDDRRGGAACVALADQSCQSSTWQALCVAGRRVECDANRGRLVEAGRCAAP